MVAPQCPPPLLGALAKLRCPICTGRAAHPPSWGFSVEDKLGRCLCRSSKHQDAGSWALALGVRAKGPPRAWGHDNWEDTDGVNEGHSW